MTERNGNVANPIKITNGHEYLTTTQAGRWIGCAPRTIAKLTDSGVLKYHRVGSGVGGRVRGDRRIHRRDLAEYLRSIGRGREADELEGKDLAGPSCVLAVGVGSWIENLGLDFVRADCLFEAGQLLERFQVPAIIWDGSVGLFQLRPAIARVAAQRPEVRQILILYEDQAIDGPEPCAVCRYPIDPADLARDLAERLEKGV